MPNRRRANYNLNRSRVMSRNYNSVSYISAIKLGPVTHTIIVSLMVMILGLIYLTQAAQVTSFDYEIQRIEGKINNLTVQKSSLEVENARLTAIRSVKDSTVAARMKSPQKVEYADLKE